MSLISLGDQVLTKKVYGTDETVLWETPDNQGHNTVTLSEPYTNFEKIAICCGSSNGNDGVEIKYFSTSFDIKHISYQGGSGGNEYWIACFIENTVDKTTLTISKGKAIRGSYTSSDLTGVAFASDSLYANCFFKVWGINRKEDA